MNEVRDGRSDELEGEAQARRDFLKSAGKFAAVTPPAIVLLLGTTLGSKAIAASSGRPGLRLGNNNRLYKKYKSATVKRASRLRVRRRRKSR